MEIVLIHLSALPEDRLSALLSLLPEAKKERIKRYRQPMDQIRSASAYAFLFYLLDKRGYGREVELKINEHGRPYIPDIDFSFSISHSGEYAALAYEEERIDLGVDIQAHRETESTGIAESFFAEEERAYLKRQSDPVHAFFDLWTRKEAYMKARGLGLSIPLSSFSAIQEEVGEYNLLSFDAMGGYSLSLCANKPLKDVRLSFISLEDLLSSYGI